MLTKSKILLIVVVFVIGIFSRLIPHLPNATAIISLSLFSAVQFSRTRSLLIVLAMLFFSDLLLSLLNHYPLFGSWSWFTYSGIIVITFFGRKLRENRRWLAIGICGVSACLFFWLWTNFGTFLLAGMYPHTFSGLFTCYFMALPFLGHSLLANLIWLPLLFWVPLKVNDVKGAHADVETPDSV